MAEYLSRFLGSEIDNAVEKVRSGIVGPPGADGASAYEIWISEGNVGTEQDFLDSLVGEPGAQGARGEDGLDGFPGNDGNDGKDGAPATINGMTILDIVDGTNTTVAINGNQLQINAADSIRKHSDLSGLGFVESGHEGFASADAVNAKYTKPESGIPKTDMDEGVQTSLASADTAYNQLNWNMGYPGGGVGLRRVFGQGHITETWHYLLLFELSGFNPETLLPSSSVGFMGDMWTSGSTVGMVSKHDAYMVAHHGATQGLVVMFEWLTGYLTGSTTFVPEVIAANDTYYMALRPSNDTNRRVVFDGWMIGASPLLLTVIDTTVTPTEVIWTYQRTSYRMANNTLKGNIRGVADAPQNLTPAEVKTMLNVGTDDVAGLRELVGETNTITLTNTEASPFNNSQTSVTFQNPRKTTDYSVITEPMVTPQNRGRIGDIYITDKLLNGCKIEYTGSAESVTIQYRLIGGMG